MCGIAGWISLEEDVRERREALEAMSATLERRGPDDGGMCLAPQAGLVHRRLAVVDIEGGRQPMAEGEYTIVYNGELYNTEELRSELLGRGWTFRGHSDTEVLLKAFVEWGEECLEKLSGIYAFAVWDAKRQRLFAARDRVGVKPFFFYEDGHRLLFGSVIPTLIAAAPWCEGLRPRLDREGRRELFLLGPGRKPGSGVLKGYRELEPGQCLWYDENGLRVRRYWDLRARPHTEDRQETVEHTRFLVEDAVGRQLVSDVPLCAMLSGGLDSSILSALAAAEYRKRGETLHTWSVDYADHFTHQHTDAQPRPRGKSKVRFTAHADTHSDAHTLQHIVFLLFPVLPFAPFSAHLNGQYRHTEAGDDPGHRGQKKFLHNHSSSKIKRRAISPSGIIGSAS